jgi:hypothetical protein
MNRIFNNQSLMRIELGYTVSPGTITASKIKYRNPNGVLGFYTAIHDPSEKTLSYTFLPTQKLEIAGMWWFWSEVTLDTGHIIQGEPVPQLISNEGYL